MSTSAWHGPDLLAALADATPALAFWRPAAGRRHIAEIALHHAYCARNPHAPRTTVRAPEGETSSRIVWIAHLLPVD